MSLFLFAALLGMGAGYLTGGRLRTLGTVVFRAPALVLAAIALQAALGLPGAGRLGAGGRFAVVTASYLLVAQWLRCNMRSRPPVLRLAFAVVALGWMLNAAVMAPNHGMPVSASALARIGRGGVDISTGHLWKHVRASGRTPLRVLGDVIPLSAGPYANVISAGDIAMLAGISLAVSAAMQPRTGEHARGALVQ
jgi:hypothetical protein